MTRPLSSLTDASADQALVDKIKITFPSIDCFFATQTSFNDTMSAIATGSILERRYQRNEFWTRRSANLIFDGRLSFPRQAFPSSDATYLRCRAWLELHLNVTRFIVNNGRSVRSHQLVGELDEVSRNETATTTFGAVGLDGNDNVIRNRCLVTAAQGRFELIEDLLRAVHDVFWQTLCDKFEVTQRGLRPPPDVGSAIYESPHPSDIGHIPVSGRHELPLMFIDYNDWRVVGLETYWECTVDDATGYVHGLSERASAQFPLLSRTEYLADEEAAELPDIPSSEGDEAPIDGLSEDQEFDGNSLELIASELEDEAETAYAPPRLLRFTAHQRNIRTIQRTRALDGLALLMRLRGSGDVKLSNYAKLPDRVRFEIRYPRSLRSTFPRTRTGNLPEGIEGLVALVRHAAHDAAERVKLVSLNVDLLEPTYLPAAVNILDFLGDVTHSCRTHGVLPSEILSQLVHAGTLTSGRDQRWDAVIADLERRRYLERSGVWQRGNARYRVLHYRYLTALRECWGVIELHRRENLAR